MNTFVYSSILEERSENITNNFFTQNKLLIFIIILSVIIISCLLYFLYGYYKVIIPKKEDLIKEFDKFIENIKYTLNFHQSQTRERKFNVGEEKQKFYTKAKDELLQAYLENPQNKKFYQENKELFMQKFNSIMTEQLAKEEKVLSEQFNKLKESVERQQLEVLSLRLNNSLISKWKTSIINFQGDPLDFMKKMHTIFLQIYMLGCYPLLNDKYLPLITSDVVYMFTQKYPSNENFIHDCNTIYENKIPARKLQNLWKFLPHNQNLLPNIEIEIKKLMKEIYNIEL